MSDPKNVAILIFDEVEVLDFCGPFEVFSVAGKRSELEPFNVFTVAENPGPIAARNNLSVNPSYSFDDCPKPDILLVPGGFGTRALLNNERVLGWIKERAGEVEYLLSVCTGSFLLAKAGLLEGLRSTTHHMGFDQMRKIGANTEILEDHRVVDNGDVVLSAGVASGIDMSFHMIRRILGEAHAIETASYIEYPWDPNMKIG